MSNEVNPLEQEVLDFADVYAELVLDLADHFAPFRPWWEVALTPDQQLWRYMESRPKFMSWITVVSPYMGWESFDEAMGELDDLWLSKKADAAVPITLQAAVPVELLELVQAEPADAAKHIRKMERMIKDRLPAMRALAGAEGVFPATLAPRRPVPTTIDPASEVMGVPLTPGPGATSAPVVPPAGP